MKLLRITAITIVFIFAMMTTALAADNIVVNGDFSTDTQGWEGTGIQTEKEGLTCLSFYNEQGGFSYQYTTINLEPESYYKISCDVYTHAVSSYEFGAHFYLDDYAAVSHLVSGDTNGWEELSIYIKTDSNEKQEHILYLALEDEGDAFFTNVCVEKTDVAGDVAVYSIAGGVHENTITTEDESNGDSITLSEIYNDYNRISLIIVCLLITVFIYMFIHSKWTKKLADKKYIVLIFVIAFVIRIIMAARTEGFVSDISCFRAWAYRIFLDPQAFYSGDFFVDYPPIYMYVLYIVGFIQNLFGIDWYSTAMLVLLKLPAILSDLGIGVVLFKIAENRGYRLTGILLAVFTLFNPAVIINSTVWGQIDAVFSLAMLGVLLAITNDKKVLCAALFAVAVLLKPHALIFAPVVFIVFLADLLKKETFKDTLSKIFLSIAAILAVYTLVCSPFLGIHPWYFMIERLLNAVGEYAFASVNAFNLFALFGANYASDSDTLLFMSYKAWGTMFIVLSAICVAAIHFKRRNKQDVLILCAFFGMAVFMLAHQMHERYLFPAFIFMIAAAAVYASKKLLMAAFASSISFFINQYIVFLFKGQLMIPYYMVAIGSLLNIAAFALLIYAMICVFKGQIYDFVPVEATPENTSERIKNRNSNELITPSETVKMTKKDWAIMLAVTVVYAAVAFTNLGTTKIPETGSDELRHGDSILLELESPEYIDSYRYYAGYGESKYKVEYSADGVTFYDTGTEVDHQYKNMFKWNIGYIESSVKYVRFTVESGNKALDMREIALINEQDEVAKVKSYAIIDGVKQENSVFTDEQELTTVSLTYMTNMYFDEVYHARTAYEYLHDEKIYEITHPPLGKTFIELGCKIFGFNPFGWRFMGTLAGVLMLPVLYMLAKLLFKRTLYSAISIVLFASDFMHFAQTRIATIDSYSILFIMLMFLFMLRYTQLSFNRDKLLRTLLPLGLCGLFFGLGAATKWLCLYAGAGLAVIFFYTVYRRWSEHLTAPELTPDFTKNLIITLLFCVVMFIIVPLSIYVWSYKPYFEVNPDFGFKGILDNQSYMFNYHAYLDPDSVHPFSSMFYTWPLNIRPVYFFSGGAEAVGNFVSLSTFGNPIVWWGGLLAVFYIASMKKSKQASFKGVGFLAVAIAAEYVPWMLITREVYIYHYFAVIPFLILITVYALRDICQNKAWGRKFAFAFTAVCVIMFVVFYPVITGLEIPHWYMYLVRWLPTWPIYG